MYGNKGRYSELQCIALIWLTLGKLVRKICYRNDLWEIKKLLQMFLSLTSDLAFLNVFQKQYFANNTGRNLNQQKIVT